METAGIVANQVLVMFLLIGVGALLSKIGMISEKGAKDMASLTCYVVAPSLIAVSYQRDYVASEAHTLIWCFVLSVVTHLVGIVISRILFRKNEKHFPNERHAIAQFGTIFSNSGFFAYPLLQAVFGSVGIFYGCAATAVFQVVCWTYGVILFKGHLDKKQLSKLFLNPAILGAVLGLILYFTGWRLPDQVNTTLSYIGDLNTPLAMLIIGTWVAGADWKSAIKDWTLFAVSGVRLLVIPLIMIGLYLVLPLDETIFIAALLPAAAPCGANTAVLPALYDKDRFYGSQLVAISTLISIVTLPCIVALGQMLRG